MAIFFSGMSRDEAVALTLAMRDSGDVLDWSDLPGPVTDKHSTGGVGDNVSLMLAPIVAACGGYRADDLRPRPRPYRRHARQDGRDPGLSQPARQRAVSQDGRATSAAPSSARPPTSRRPTSASMRSATSPRRSKSVPLITASILSKKLAAGLQVAGARREGRQRRLHGRIARRQRAGGQPGRGGQRRGPEDHAR